jgi:uncharacterized membrane protein YbhN (UPF0104 family)
MVDTRSTARDRLNLTFRWLWIVATVITLWWFLRRVDVHKLGAAVDHANIWLLALAVLLNIGGNLVRAVSWVAMLGPRHPVPFGRLVRYEFAAQAASAISPARAGEVLRLWMLRRENVPESVTVALVVLKKAIGALGIAVLAVVTPLLLSGLPAWLPGFVVLVAVSMTGLVGLLVLVSYRVKPDRVPKFLRRVVDGMYFLRDPRRLSSAVAVILVGEVIDAAAAFAVLRALHIDLSIAAAVLVLFLIDFSNALPSAPGNAGTFEVGALYLLNFLNVPPSPALGFALLFHAQQVLPQVIIGLPLLLRFLGGKAKQSVAAVPEG